jgi:hypothetical protein
MVTRRSNFPLRKFALLLISSYGVFVPEEVLGGVTDVDAATDLPTVFVDWPKCGFVH